MTLIHLTLPTTTSMLNYLLQSCHYCLLHNSSVIELQKKWSLKRKQLQLRKITVLWCGMLHEHKMHLASLEKEKRAFSQTDAWSSTLDICGILQG